MNGFEKHGLTHSSPSALNMWAECPAAWAARYLYGKSFHFGVAPQIGILVEQVVADVLTKTTDLKQALEQAHKTFLRNNAFNANEKETDRINDIEPMAVNALQALTPYGEPEFISHIDGRKQQYIELKCNADGWSIPVIGYLDFVFPEHGLVVDLKTTLRIPSSLSSAHQRQGAVYSKACGNKAVKFLYVSPKKSAVLDIENIDQTLDEIKTILKRQEEMLRLHDADTLRRILPVNVSSFYWNGSESIRKELYGL